MLETEKLIKQIEVLIDEALVRQTAHNGQALKPRSWRIVAMAYDDRGGRPKQRRFSLRELLCPPLPIAQTEVDKLELTTRAANCLTNVGVETIEQLLRWSETDFLKVPNMGAKSIQSIKDELARHGLKLPDKSLLSPGENPWEPPHAPHT